MQTEYVKGLTFTYFCTLFYSMWGCPLNHLWSFCAWLAVSPWTFSTLLNNNDRNVEMSFSGNRLWSILEVTVCLASQSSWVDEISLSLFFTVFTFGPVFSSTNCSCITKFMSSRRRTYPHIPVPDSCSKTRVWIMNSHWEPNRQSAGVYCSFCHVLSLPVSDVYLSLSHTFSIIVSLFLFLLHVPKSHLDVLCQLLTTLPTFPLLSFDHPAFPTYLF